jgi:Domain of unknown function (DUF1874)
MMARYLLNAAVCTNPGIYRYELVDVDGARAWAAKGRVESCVGYASAAQFLEMVLGFRVKVNRVVSPMKMGDEGLVCRLSSHAGRLPREAVQRGGRAIADEWGAEHGYELGVLKRIG